MLGRFILKLALHSYRTEGKGVEYVCRNKRLLTRFAVPDPEYLESLSEISSF